MQCCGVYLPKYTIVYEHNRVDKIKLNLHGSMCTCRHFACGIRKIQFKMADGRICVSVFEGTFAGLEGVGVPLLVCIHLQDLGLQFGGAQWTAKQSTTDSPLPPIELRPTVLLVAVHPRLLRATLQ